MRRLTILMLLALGAVVGGAWPVDAQTTVTQATITPAPYPYGYPVITLPAGGAITMCNGCAVRTDTTSGHTFSLSGYTGSVYSPVLTVTNAATPTLTMGSQGLTFNGSVLLADAANVLALKNADTAQEFRVYGATTGTKYASLSHTGSAGHISSYASLLIGSYGVDYWKFDTTNGNLLTAVDGVGGIGAPSATRPGYINIGGRTLTANTQPALNIAETWNDGAGGTVTFTGIKGNWTDTASAAGSLLMDLQVGSVSKFKVTKAGDITTGGSVYSGAAVMAGATSPIYWNGRTALYSRADGYLSFQGIAANLPGFQITAGTPPTLTVIGGDGAAATNLAVSGTLTVSGMVSLFGTGQVALNTNSVDGAPGYDVDNANLYLNYHGYAGGYTRDRNTVIADGKAGAIATFTGSTKATTLAGTLTVSGASVTIPYLASTTGTRYVCSDTSGVLSASASACSGTDPDALAAQVNALSLTVAQLQAELAALKGGRQ